MKCDIIFSGFTGLYHRVSISLFCDDIGNGEVHPFGYFSGKQFYIGIWFLIQNINTISKVYILYPG